jgi:hypothetical protein
MTAVCGLLLFYYITITDKEVNLIKIFLEDVY